jgi:predicted nucleic acid-binding protein
MTLVVDASVVLKWFVDEPESLQARALVEEADAFAAPDLIIAEVANVFWRKGRLGETSSAQATEALEELMVEIDLFVACGELWSAAFRASEVLDHPVYDCFYLALAQRLDAPLVTADKRLLAQVARTPFARHVRALT